MTEYPANPTSATSVNGTSIDGKSKINSNGIEIKVKNIFKSYSLIVHFSVMLAGLEGVVVPFIVKDFSPLTFHFSLYLYARPVYRGDTVGLQKVVAFAEVVTFYEFFVSFIKAEARRVRCSEYQYFIAVCSVKYRF